MIDHNQHGREQGNTTSEREEKRHPQLPKPADLAGDLGIIFLGNFDSYHRPDLLGRCSIPFVMSNAIFQKGVEIAPSTIHVHNRAYSHFLIVLYRFAWNTSAIHL